MAGAVRYDGGYTAAGPAPARPVPAARTPPRCGTGQDTGIKDRGRMPAELFVKFKAATAQ